MGTVVNEEKLKAMAAELAKDIKSEKDLGELSRQLMKLTVETALGAEMSEHLGYEKHQIKGRNSGTAATVIPPKSSRASTARWRSSPRATVMPASSRSCWPRGKRG